MARLAFAKIKSLHGALAEYRQAADAKSAAVAGLQQTIAGLEEAARQRDVAVEEAEAKLAQVGGRAGLGAGLVPAGRGGSCGLRWLCRMCACAAHDFSNSMRQAAS